MSELNERENLGETSGEGRQAEAQNPQSEATANSASPQAGQYTNPGMPQGNPYVDPYNAYANPRIAQRYNSFAVGGFVASFFVSIIGIVLSVIGLSEIKKQGGKGRGLAIAGIVIGTVKIIAEIILIIVVIIGAVSWIEQESRNGGLDGYSYEYNFGDFDNGHNGNRDHSTDGHDHGDFDDFDDLFGYQYQGDNTAAAFA
ncbi:DUF4190 domain-containing protein [Bifidobacterium felsineum]|uniref:DUF4190 domain-containing protein n=1 Tax=Bifidobacterium felsineum TaxID=2045440 RepID=A0A2M9HIE1_9BIFI|nr:DUF4190 domain-containing protein [Bifidobacterium felsineum]MBT1164393.1 DUF4190 domain-containing protein [Bifidobacterium felsineum]PJM76559.1 hypothetical protein CSQ86_08725 [Bifidobacterium felsineum]